MYININGPVLYMEIDILNLNKKSLHPDLDNAVYMYCTILYRGRV